MQGSAGVSALAFSPGADALATGNGNGSIQLWSLGLAFISRPPRWRSDQSARARRPAHPPAAFSADGGLLVTSNGHGTVRVWNVTGRRPTGPPMGSYHTVTGLALSPDGKTLAVAGRLAVNVADRYRPADRRSAAVGRDRAVPGRGVQPGRHDAGHPGRGRHGTDLGRGHPAASRPGDDRGRTGRGRRGGGVQPRRQYAGHGGRRRPGRAVERGHPPAARQAHARGPGPRHAGV